MKKNKDKIKKALISVSMRLVLEEFVKILVY